MVSAARGTSWTDHSGSKDSPAPSKVSLGCPHAPVHQLPPFRRHDHPHLRPSMTQQTRIIKDDNSVAADIYIYCDRIRGSLDLMSSGYVLHRTLRKTEVRAGVSDRQTRRGAR